MHDKEIVLRDVWRTCNKIRAAIFRIKGLNLYDFFKPLDPNGTNFVKESEFISVFAHQLRGAIGLSDQEIGDLADYFRVQDGRIFYSQLCEVIHKEPNFEKNADLVTGLEWNDPMHENCLSASEKRRFCLLITKIATIVNMRRLVLRPYFQDYELIAKNVGAVTIAHFARILSFLKIMLSSTDFNLLVKKYLRDNYTINYVAFIKDVDNAVQYMDQHGMLDIGGDLITLFPGRIISADLPKLPRPEIGHKDVGSVFGQQTIFHPVLSGPYEQEALLTVIRRIQRHVLENGIRIKDFFQDFDPLNCGRCTISQFCRALDAMGVGRLGRLYISPYEFNSLSIQYRDPADPTRICYDVFETDIERVFTTRELEKHPLMKVDVPPREVVELPRKGAKNWHDVIDERRQLCEETLMKIKRRVISRGISLLPLFKDYDKHNNGHVSRAQVRQVLCSNGILLTKPEVFTLDERYNDDVGFNYNWFLKELDSQRVEEPLFNKYFETIKKINAEPKPKDPDRRETDIVCILAKIKGKVVRERVGALEFLKQYDKTNTFAVSRADFKRALNICRFELTEAEYETLMNVFACPERPQCVDYRRFVAVIEEALAQASLERAPRIVPLQHIPTKDCDRNFLNFDERIMVSSVLHRLAKRLFRATVDFWSIFKLYDKPNCGTVSRDQFAKSLDMGGLLRIITAKELDVLCKCFGFERGLRNEVDYRAFCQTLDLLHETLKEKPI